MITGGTGFIGSRLALRVHADGDDVVVLGQRNTRIEEANAEELRTAGVDVIDGSVTNAGQLRDVMTSVGVVYHLAAAQHEANVGADHFYQVNVEGTRNVCEAALVAGVERIVHGGTIGVYGSAAHGQLSELTVPSPANVYGTTKLAGERVALSYADRIPVTVIRISETYGPGDYRLLKLFRAVEKGTFFLVGPGLNLHQLIYVDDLIRGMSLAARSPHAVGEIFVLAGSEVLTTRDMVDVVGAAFGKRGARLSLPMWPFLAAAVVLENTLGRVGIQPPLHRRRLDFFRKSFYFSPEKSASLLGFEAQSDFHRGVEATVRWYRDRGLL
ncbi:MAG: hypothetical protein B7Z66_11245 [Chromatiales bacterium 21-64-14]|nr:MAG: hypothetical protein B7Z66_11245 [Chromatiales bacterium 21-64-14]HQU16763.1 NAD(P)-dependent oxidoreductase [Gammaproteobacteria bacterium]